jgi:hypothetical protein
MGKLVKGEHCERKLHRHSSQIAMEHLQQRWLILHTVPVV